MLKPHNLTLNNVICYQINENELSEPMFVESISKFFVELNYEDCYAYAEYDTLRGIPITDEMLEKCEFKKAQHDQYSTIWENDGALFTFEKVRDWVLFKHGQRIEHIRYIHELQNAYYMLTNEYLNVNI